MSSVEIKVHINAVNCKAF